MSGPRRRVLAVLSGLSAAAVVALILGEYPFTGATPYLGIVLVPSVIGAPLVPLWGSRRDVAWAVTGPLAGASVAWAVCISTGAESIRSPPPVGVAIVASVLWPLAWAGWLCRHRIIDVDGSRPGRPESGTP